jgi:hypothetical protein
MMSSSFYYACLTGIQFYVKIFIEYSKISSMIQNGGNRVSLSTTCTL